MGIVYQTDSRSDTVNYTPIQKSLFRLKVA